MDRPARGGLPAAHVLLRRAHRAERRPGPPPSEDLSEKLTGKERTRELLRGITILGEYPQISLAVIVRILCNLTLYGFPMMMPLYLTRQLDGSEPWFTQTEWMSIWAIMNTITIVANIVWGRLGGRYGWMRVSEACRLLRTTTAPIGQIYWEAGFSNASNFNRRFKEETGITPREYRAHHRSG